MSELLKRTTDITVSGSALAVFGPVLMLPIAIVIKLTSPGPVLFRQDRMGRGGKPFSIYKFRSMIVNAPDLRNEDGSTYSGDDDPRVTKIGKFIRKTSLDELPQLINVFKGEMSLVGPRPDKVDQLQYYSDQEKRKLEVKPGMTGLAQISGRNEVFWGRRKQLDVEYVERQSFWFDLKILLATIPYVLARRGVNAPSSAEHTS